MDGEIPLPMATDHKEVCITLIPRFIQIEYLNRGGGGADGWLSMHSRSLIIEPLLVRSKDLSLLFQLG